MVRGISVLGRAMYSDYVYIVIMGAIILLVAMVGSMELIGGHKK